MGGQHEEYVALTESEVEKLKQSEKLKLKQISEMESKIETISENLIEKEDLIFNLNNKMEKYQSEIDNLKEELKKYDSLRQINVVATAYEAFCDTGCIGITATGHDVSDTVYKDGKRVVAVDPNVIPLGSLLYVETETMSFIGVAEDTGGAIKGSRIDILMKNDKRATSFGVQNANVTVLTEGNDV